MPQVIVTHRDTSLMNFVTKKFPTSYALLCRNHIRNNAILGNKQTKGENGKTVKPNQILELIMDVWNVINSYTNELFVDYVIQFISVCVKYLNILKYINTIILDQVKEKIVCAWTDQVRHFGNITSNRGESSNAR